MAKSSPSTNLSARTLSGGLASSRKTAGGVEVVPEPLSPTMPKLPVALRFSHATDDLLRAATQLMTIKRSANGEKGVAQVVALASIRLCTTNDVGSFVNDRESALTGNRAR